MLPPVTAIMPTTAARRWCLPLAVECWRTQTYRETELLVVFDGPGRADDLLPDDARIRYVTLDDKRTLGDKINTCVHLARYDWITYWSDDDWCAPHRLAMTARCVADNEAVEVVGDTRMLIHELGPRRRTFLFEYPADAKPAYLVGGTLTFARSVWERLRFPSIDYGEDGEWVIAALDPHRGGAKHACLPDPLVYVAMMHGANTGNTQVPTGDPWWHPWAGNLAALVGAETLTAYEEAYHRRKAP